jgi:hypothetical protein
MTEKPAAKSGAEQSSSDNVPGKEKTLVVRLLADYWDAQGVRHSCAYTDENGEKRSEGALIELPANEARQLVKSSAAERGDEY